jgi:hypothetical protein
MAVNNDKRGILATASVVEQLDTQTVYRGRSVLRATA